MSQTTTETQDPLSTEGKYSGMLYWINTPSGYTLNLDNLKQHIDEKVFSQDITEEVDSTTEVPEIFRDGDQVVRRTSIYNTKAVDSPYGTVVTADVKMDRDGTVNYRDTQILTMDAYQAKLLFFKQDGVNYCLVVASRAVSTDVAEMLRKKFDELGDLINETRLPDSSLRQIVEDLDASLVDTILGEFPDEDVETLEWTGEGYEDHPDYEKHEKRGETQNHMFWTQKLVGSGTTTVRIANDGLIRIYNKVPLDVYVRLITQYVVPTVHRDNTGSSSLDTFEKTDHPILEEVDTTS